jgi:hypothetical protein
VRRAAIEVIVADQLTAPIKAPPRPRHEAFSDVSVELTATRDGVRV